MSKTEKIEITKDMTIGNRAFAIIHNNKVDVLERMSGTTLVMLELPTHLVKNAIDICEEVNAKYT